MLVKQRLRIQAIIVVITAAIILLVLSLALNRVNRALEEAGLASELVIGAFERNAFRADYMRNDNERARVQWFAKHERLGKVLQSAREKFRDAEGKKTVAALLKDHEAIGKLFSGLVENREKKRVDPAGAALAQEIENRLANQLDMRLYERTLLGRTLRDVARSHLVSAFRLAGWGIFGVLVILIAAALINSWTLGRSIADRIGRLRDGAAVIGGGDLDHRIDIRGNDEFAELSGAFNAMTAKLGGSYHDLEKEIEERKQAEERYRTLFDTMISGFCIIEVIFDSEDRPVDYRFLACNPAFEAQTGLQNAQGQLMRELAPDHEAHWFEIYGKIALTGEPARFVNEARALNRWYDVAAYRVGRPENRQVAIVFNDITDRKRAEEKLQKAYGELELRVAERTQELEEANASVREINETLEQRVAERTAELEAANASLRDSRRAALNLMEDAVAARGEAEASSLELQREAAERKRVAEEREIAAGFLRLINESKNSEELVRSAVGYLREHAGCEAVGIRLKDGDDYPYYEVHGFPEQFIRLENSLCARDEAGRPLRDSAGDPVMECMCGNVIQGRFDPSQSFFSARGSFWTNSTTELLATTTEADRQARTRNRCHGEGYESVALIAIRAGAAPLGLLQLNDLRQGRFSPERIALWERLADYLGIALEKFQAEKSLEHSVAELEGANKELESFIYSVSHDLQGPLRSMGVFTKIIVRDYSDRLDEKGREHFRRIEQASRRMNRIIEDMLHLSRVSRYEIKPEEVDLSELGQNVMARLHESSPGREVAAAIQEGLFAHADLRLMELALSNLLGNAWKFTSKTALGRIEFGALEQEGKIVYYVRDNGAGFDPEQAGKMFLPFQRLHGNEEFEGTGIGLGIVELAIRRHGGKVWAEGEVGKGATVFFTLA